MNEPDSDETIFAAALQWETPAQRAAYLDEACGGNAALRRRVEELLRASDDAGTFLDRPVGEPKPAVTAPKPPATIQVGFAEDPTEAPGAVIGRYKLLQQIGEGGCGTVFMAEQEEPVRRRVALKVIKLGMDTKQVVARFEAERQALAMMDHPNIAKVLDAGATDSGRPFFVMELVRGIPITRYCDENKLDTQQRLDLFIKVCQAIQHAHQKGIIHRDIKPSNILVTLHDGVPVPKVIDFGIAKATEGRLTNATLFTAFEQFIGTPAYMSPEQAEMSGLDIDTRSDIYALGVLLYELLTGKTPFDAKELAQSGLDAMRKTIREREPQRPSTRLSTMLGDALTATANAHGSDAVRLLKLIRGDLDWIVMKCLEKDRTRRYETANGLAADLKRHLNNEPVVARPPSTAYRFQKAFRRNKVAFTAATAVGAALLVGISASVWQAARATKAKIQADTSRQAAQASEQKAVAAQANEAQLRQQAEAARLISRRQAYASDMNAVQNALASDNLGRARVLLYRHRPEPGEVDLRGWEWRYLWQFCQSDAQSTVKEPDGDSIRSVALSADAKWAAAVSLTEGPSSVYNLQTREINPLPVKHAKWVAFSPREPLLAIATEGSTGGANQSLVLLWDVNTRQVVRELSLGGFCIGLSFSEDGQTLATGSGSPDSGAIGEVALWRVADGSKVTGWPVGVSSGHNGLLWFAATGDASAAAVVSALNKVSVTDLKSGRERWSALATDDKLTCLAFSADGRILATGAGYVDPVIRLWDAQTGKPLGRLEGQHGWTAGLVFLADGKHLISASADQTLRLWDLETHSLVRSFRGHKLEVYALALAADQRTLLSGGKDGSAYLWDLSAERSASSSGTIRNMPEAWVFADGGNAIVTVDQDGHVVRRHGRTFQAESPLLELGTLSSNNISPSVLSPKRPLLAVLTAANKIQVWDWERRTRVQEWDARTEAGLNFPAVVSADGTKLFVVRPLTGTPKFSTREWDLATGRETRSFDLLNFPRSISLSPDGTQVIGIVNGDEESWRLDLLSGRVTLLNLNTPQISGGTVVAFSPDTKSLAVPSGMGFVRIIDIATLRATATFSGFMFGVHGAGYSPDQQRLAIGSTAHEALTIWDVNNHERLLTLAAPVGVLSPVYFSPDGNVVGGRQEGNGPLYFWRAPTWAEIAAVEAKDKAEGKQP